MASSEPPAPDVEICEVGPRDGLQNLDRLFSIDEKVELIRRLARTGVPRIEVGSFVNPKRVPQMAGIEEVLAELGPLDGTRVAGLAMNRRGVDRAIAAGIDEVRFVIVASETLSRRNQAMSIAETMAAFREIEPVVHGAGKALTGAVAAAFGCPYEGPIAPEVVADLVAAAVDGGADEVFLADTIGVGVPWQVSGFCDRLRAIAGGRRFGFHFHNTRNTGYANAIAAVGGGATMLDSSIGGMGGCPFAPNATGNIATEDLFYLLRQSGIATGLDGAALLEAVTWLRQLVPHEISGQLIDAGYFPESVAPVTEAEEMSA